MKNENNIEDQAGRLRRIVGDPNQKETKTHLPPRSEAHASTKKKSKWKIKYPVVRLLALFFILLPITIVSLYYYYNNTFLGSKQSNGYETVDIVEKKKVESKPKDVYSIPKVEPIKNTSLNKTEVINKPVEEKPIPNSDTNVNKVKQEEYDIILHTVQPKETLYRIAMKYYGEKSGIEKIKKWNNLKSAIVNKGQILKVPILKKEKK